MAIAMIMAIIPTTMYVIRSVVVARFDAVVAVWLVLVLLLVKQPLRSLLPMSCRMNRRLRMLQLSCSRLQWLESMCIRMCLLFRQL